MKIHKLFSVIAIFGFFTLAASALAATGDYVPLVQIPGIPAGANFLQYLSGIYNFLISIVGILAMASLVYGGFRYLTSVGNPAAVEDAKDIINSAIIGLVLALSSWLILNEINPDILVLKKPSITGASGKYAYNQPPSTRACVADTNLEGVSIPNDPTKKKCSCADGQNVTFTPSTPPTGPYVVSTSIAPCAKNVPTNTSSMTINFNEAVDPTSVSAMTIKISQINVGIYTTTYTVATSGSTVTVNFMASPPYLDATTAYKIDVTAGIKDLAGNNMVSDYIIEFTTDAGFPIGKSCTPPPQVVVDCTGACSNPSTKDLNPPGYHCLKADLRVGDNLNNMVSDKISINAGQKLYFDMSNSKDYIGNQIARYEINWNGAPTLGLFGDFTCCPIAFTTKCIGWPSLCPITSDCPTAPPLVTDHTYTTAGTYTVWYSVYNDNCASATNPQAIYVNVK